jgi:hypothetical protein
MWIARESAKYSMYISKDPLPRKVKVESNALETASYKLLKASGFFKYHQVLVSPFLQATKALREGRDVALLCFQTSALEGS